MLVTNGFVRRRKVIIKGFLRCAMSPFLNGNKHMKQLLDSIWNYVCQNGYTEYERCKKIRNEYVQADTICLYGTGKFYNDYKMNVKHYEFVSDKNPDKWGKYIDGRYCLSPEELREREDVLVVVMLGDYKDALDYLKNIGCKCVYFGDVYKNVYDVYHDKEWFEEKRELVKDAFDLFAEEQSQNIFVTCLANRLAPHLSPKTYHDIEENGEYFFTGLFDFTDDETYVDAGAYDGDSIVRFADAVHGKYECIYGFELDRANYKRLIENTAKLQKIHLFDKGLGGKSEIICFQSNNSGSHIVDQASDTAEIVRLDDVVEGKVTFLKMDIEGMEKEAIQGGEKLIKVFSPKLAISVYHKLEDIWEIPLRLKTLQPQYEFFLRHHTAIAWDTNCYARIREE